ncbi:MAG TPA: zinc ribbon domain-containing protein [Chloroflexi bacterium]|nr:zinc ribbon domain-containing protein [Chloroflexota bacterium]
MIPTGLLALVAVIIVGAYIAQPFFAARRGEGGGGQGGRRTASLLRRRADLLAERNRLYRAIRDLDFDYQTNKVSEEDYQAQRHRLFAEAVEVLQQLDSLPALDETPESDPIEAAVAALRQGTAPEEVVSGPAAEGEVCPQCGEPVSESDRFCGACGARLR